MGNIYYMGGILVLNDLINYDLIDDSFGFSFKNLSFNTYNIPGYFFQLHTDKIINGEKNIEELDRYDFEVFI